MKLTYYGHSCFEMELGSKKLLFDPFISGNEMAKDIDINAIDADYILISHGHGDHVADAETIAKRTGAPIISNYEIVSWYGEKGLKGHPLNHGGKWNFDFGTVQYVNAIHSSVLPDGTYGGNPGGFVISNENDGTFYYAGDTALTWDMKLIPMTCPKLDVAILPIGDNFTMGYQDAILASDFVECNNIIACHFDTFGYIKVDRNTVIAAFKAKGKQIRLPNIGDTLEI